MKHRLLILLFALIACGRNSDTTYSSSADRAEHAEQLIPTFTFADSFQIELFAIDPLIGDPVAMEIDEQGNIYVLEMHGYPLDLSGSGVIKLLEDTDEDGFPDKSTVYADGLTLPTGLMRWKNGLIVTDAPNVWYLEDTDGDRKADHREIILTGFALSNPQHNLNSPVYGLDNGIYLANEYYITTVDYEELLGDKGEEIRFPGVEDSPVLPSNANDRSVRFRPDTRELSMMASQTQYGHTFDPWGNYFQTSNANHLHHEVIGAQYLERNPDILIENAMQYMPDYGRAVEVYPTTHNPEHQLLTDIGTMTSACGINWYKGGMFPPRYDQTIFTAEPVHNLIRVDSIYQTGGTFKASKVWEDREFLASTDAWFRPVFLYTGPDGAIYVVDYYRKIIEHPEWMAESVNNSGELYEGTNLGRIYRITPKGKDSDFLPGQPLIDTSSVEKLVAYLESDNIWWRQHAQRLLVDMKSPQASSSLIQLIETTDRPTAKVHALWTLEGMDASEVKVLQKALEDPHPGVRKNAIQIMERYPEMITSSMESLTKLSKDADPGVVLQLLATLGDYEETQLLRQDIVFEHYDDPWMTLAAFTSTDMRESDLLRYAMERFGDSRDPGQATFLTTLSTAIGWNEHSEHIAQLILQSDKDWKFVAALEGLSEGIRQRRKSLSLSSDVAQALVDYGWDGEDELRDAARKVLRTAISRRYVALPDIDNLSFPKSDPASLTRLEEEYADRLRLVAILEPDRYEAQFKGAISPQSPLNWQLAAIEGLGNVSEDRGCDFLLASWEELTPESREEAVTPFMQSIDRMKMLLQAVSEGVIDASAIGWRRTVRLLNNDHPEVKQMAREVLASESEDRGEVVERYKDQAMIVGDIKAGKNIFQQQCAVCHQYEGKDGTMYGPDLATVRNRLPESILKDILIPNRSIADGYELWEVSTSEDTFTGLISGETATTITLVFADGSTQTVPRKDILSLRAMPYSAMPTGIEAQISPEEMSDLLSFIRGIGK